MKPIFMRNKKSWTAVALLLAFYLLEASSQITIGWLNIDCGNSAVRVDPTNLLTWVTDKDLIQTGINKEVPQKQSLEEMNTLRSFPNQTPQNCYALPVNKQTVRYLIRVGFYYGNYDGLSNPPSFDIHIDGQKWSTVKTSTLEEGPMYHEALYETQGSGSISLCVVQVKDGGVPFISSIEAVPLSAPFNPLYPKMETNNTFDLVSRINFAGDEIRFTGLLSENYNRIWTRGTTPPNCNEVSTLPDILSPENDPPISVLRTAIESIDLTHPITLSVSLSQTTPQSAYFVLYFTETTSLPKPGDTRIIQININGQMKSTVTLEFTKCKVITLYPVIVEGTTINVTLASASSSTLPPIISAMEVFTRVDHEKSSSPPPPSPASHGTRGTSFVRTLISFLVFVCFFYC
ncbi:probable LRR receptor-like serine/threonine-protein kinase At1g51860 [Rosa rugosa]|uniref:probable LRR receptor-like serine/threonine-protein kinase At1g51860 n=1 Tax=Rosa rugosa TaxID=74645 RepID=UPI002B40709B|nr:probable LRR receptor-like serine/threonine-protein kinase At1g51860 [Rosa rugosa]